MPTIIKTKNSVTATNAPSSLQQGEVAINITDKKVWVGNAATTPVQLLGAGATASFTSITTSSDSTISGLTVGKGGGASTFSTVLGFQALASSTNDNLAIGYQAAFTNTTGSSNTAVGHYRPLYLNTTGTNNTAIGRESLYSNTTASNNTAVGYRASYSNTTGALNVAFGTESLYSNTTASNNTAVGYQAGYSHTTGTGGNTFLGRLSGYSTTGNDNTFVGNTSGYEMTTGTNNTIVGAYNGNQSGLDIRTASNRIVLSDGAGNPRLHIDASGNVFAPYVYLTVSTAVAGAVFGSDDVGLFTLSASGQKRIIPRKPNDPSAASDNLIDLGDGGSRFRTIFAGTGTINTSDANEKQQIRDLNVAEKAVATRIKKLIKAYKFNDAVAIKGDKARIHIGVIAQEVAAAFEAEGLDACKYSMFCSDTWYEVDGNTIDDQNKFVTKDTPNAVARTRLGVRYDELLAFVISTL